mmetsp:Transcript_90273/g.260261  ORF Transcript_90273/g.260261 Transcript_90273/m.260261 type:complete len:305 (+) Transcript_90273:118-1032(+)|eukprot:CAMPEP_0176054034 /NCGR_PEP_ID=MMETSP0120_2-20121206/26882_1 /TAXON_ID=160619 /ORGANISM="Kryptoperidinium foliaceum, Strain CCMP 1326" /LENGTH=304 /DNA_ID=CAMNT_0017387497 /DNA_START=117 /DNA_END=1031 /DNA_ORIENTATION=-
MATFGVFGGAADGACGAAPHVARRVCASAVRHQVAASRIATDQHGVHTESSPEQGVWRADAIGLSDFVGGGGAAYGSCARQVELTRDLFNMIGGLVQDIDFPGIKAEDSPIRSSRSTSPGASSDSLGGGETRTTIMVQRILPKSMEQDVEEMLVDLGFAGSFDVIYVPLNRKRTASLGYAFVHFTSAEPAEECLQKLRGRAIPGLTGSRACRAAYSSMQGEEFLQHVAARNGSEFGGVAAVRLPAKTRGGSPLRGSSQPVSAPPGLEHLRPPSTALNVQVAGAARTWLVPALPPAIVCGPVMSF